MRLPLSLRECRVISNLSEAMVIIIVIDRPISSSTSFLKRLIPPRGLCAESDCTYGLIRTCCLVPHHTSILCRMVGWIGPKLNLHFPVRQHTRWVIVLNLIVGCCLSLRHRKEGHVPVVLAKSECRLGVHGMRDDVGCRIIEFNARSIVEEEILSVDRVIDAFQSRSRHTKDFQTQTTRTVFLITLEKIRLICVSRGNIIGLAWFCENALTKMLWQILMDLQGTLDNALRLDMSCSECLSVKIKVVLLHTLHDLFDTLYFLLLVWLDGFYAFCVPSKVGVIGWCAGKAALDYMCKLTKKCPLPSLESCYRCPLMIRLILSNRFGTLESTAPNHNTNCCISVSELEAQGRYRQTGSHRSSYGRTMFKTCNLGTCSDVEPPTRNDSDIEYLETRFARPVIKILIPEISTKFFGAIHIYASMVYLGAVSRLCQTPCLGLMEPRQPGPYELEYVSARSARQATTSFQPSGPRTPLSPDGKPATLSPEPKSFMAWLVFEVDFLHASPTTVPYTQRPQSSMDILINPALAMYLDSSVPTLGSLFRSWRSCHTCLWQVLPGRNERRH
ncbi:heme-dependent catalase, partial [Aureobasidium melanogenum]